MDVAVEIGLKERLESDEKAVGQHEGVFEDEVDAECAPCGVGVPSFVEAQAAPDPEIVSTFVAEGGKKEIEVGLKEIGEDFLSFSL